MKDIPVHWTSCYNDSRTIMPRTIANGLVAITGVPKVISSELMEMLIEVKWVFLGRNTGVIICYYTAYDKFLLILMFGIYDFTRIIYTQVETKTGREKSPSLNH